MTSLSRLAVTPGEPAGIGPDLLIQLAQKAVVETPAELIVIADPEMMRQRAATLGLPLQLIDYPSADRPVQTGELLILPVECATTVKAGQLNTANASYVLETLTRAALGCLNGEFDAMITAPLHKGVINDAGIPFTGHTEFLAALTQAKLPVMMLAAKYQSCTSDNYTDESNTVKNIKNNNLRVSLATTHLPLKDVSAAITRESLGQVIEILHQDLKDKFGVKNPHILICGLNPHAGEGGHMGMEEIEIITPVIEHYKGKGMKLSGPLPADTLFTPKYLDTADAVLAMYHDQGLPVLKHVGFGHAVNITLGLPIIRTSVDHGTALDLAGSGKAELGSLIAAIETAVEMTGS